MGKTSASGRIGHGQLVEILATECRVEPIKAEDFLFALRDTVIEALLAGKHISVKGFGQFRRLDAAQRPVRFCMAAEMLKRLGAARKIHVEVCTKCGQHPPLENYTICRGCRNDYERDRRRKKK